MAKTPTKPETEYDQHTHVVDLSVVLNNWADQYTVKGEEILKIESYVDQSKGKAVFVISTKKK